MKDSSDNPAQSVFIKIDSSELDFEDKFFDSLRNEYFEFDEWGLKISKEKRPVFISKRLEKIEALAILKDESESVKSCPPLPKNNRIKICTLKVDLKDLMVGEALMKFIIDEAVKRGREEIYITLLDSRYELKGFLERYGFQFFGKIENDIYSRTEDIFLKRLVPSDIHNVTYDPNEFNAIFFPSMILSGVKIFLTPFAPRYHNLLFSFDREQSRFSDVKNKDCRRAMMIDKTYMTTSKIEKVSPGDILIFCRTTRRQRISAIGVVKSVKQMQNDDYGRRAMNDPMKLSEKRIDGRNKLKITFRHCFDLINGPNMKEMAKIYSVTSKKENVNSNSHSTSQVTLPLNHDVTENFETKSHFSIPQSIHPVSIEYLKSVIDFCGIDKKYFITL